MSISMRSFGTLPDGIAVTEYTLTNAKGASVSIADFGGTITGLRMPDREGSMTDVALGFPNVDIYHHGPSGSMGALIGRFGNRIGGACFELDGKRYPLDKNDGENSLHGGLIGFNKRMWVAEPAGTDDEPALILSLVSEDGDQGFPGTLSVKVTYTLTAGNSLGIHYEADTDAPTVINMTNHTYFNLSGHSSGNIFDHILQINAPYVTEADDGLIPTGRLLPCAETAYGFEKPTRLGDVLAKTPENPVLLNAGGVDFNYCAGNENQAKLIASLYSPVTGIAMDVVTDQPGVQCYTGQGLNVDGKEGVHYGRYAGVCLETQHYPDSIHQPFFPTVVLRPQDHYDTFTDFRFSVR